MEKTCLVRGVIHLPELFWASQLAKLGEALHETVYTRNKEMARLGEWPSYENTVAWKEGRSHGWEDNRCALFTIYINMWAVSLDVSIQRRYCQPPSVHLWACCTHPTHHVNDVNDVNDVMCEAWPHLLVYVPYSFGTVVWVLLRPIRTR